MFIPISVNSIKLFRMVLDLEWDLEGYLAFSVKYWNIWDANAVLYKVADVLLLFGDIAFCQLLQFVAELDALNAENRYYGCWTLRDEWSTSVER
jgi:hypothetical protein